MPKILYIQRCGMPVKATRGRIAYKSYKWSPKWASASDPNLANAPIAAGCLSIVPVSCATSRESMLLGQRNVDNKVDFLLICLSDKSNFTM